MMLHTSIDDAPPFIAREKCDLGIYWAPHACICS